MTENLEVSISGTVETVTFRKEETGFTVLDIEHEGELVVVVGTLPGVSVGEKLKLLGNWDHHPNFGKQFRARLCERELPTNSADILKYLSSGAVKGVGIVMAHRIVEAFGENSFQVMENEPQRLAQIKGISPGKAMKITQEFKKQFAVREAMIRLERYGMTLHECLRTVQVFGPNAVATVERNPYLLCEEGIGVGFQRADQIYAALTVTPDAALRQEAAVLHILRHNLGNGHTFLPRRKLADISARFLDTDLTQINDAINVLIKSRRLVAEQFPKSEAIFLPALHRAEQSSARRLQVLLQFPPAGREAAEQELTEIEMKNGIAYGEMQREAILTAVSRGLLILTGGPGTGKTTTLQAILQLYEKSGLEVALAAPTGRAAKRMSAVTGREAKTIHRLLEVEWDQNERQHFSRNAQNPLDCDALIVDELSMVDSILFASLLDALPLGCRLVLVGDSDQLPPVGAGNVLHDLIHSALLPVVALKEVFRQAMQSLIVTNAHKIVEGLCPDLERKDADFFFMPKSGAYAVARLVCDLCATRLPDAYRYSPFQDIQVICPGKKGDAGTHSLNRALQAVLNPPARDKKELTHAGRIFRVGDKVMQTKNNYDLEWVSDEKEGTGIFNGDIGIICNLFPESSTLEIRFDEKATQYPCENLIELEHAYAITVHKSQGNEFEAVILPVCGIPLPLAYRNLLYTAVTRAKQLLILTGDRTQIEKMVQNGEKAARYSALKLFLLRET